MKTFSSLLHRGTMVGTVEPVFPIQAADPIRIGGTVGLSGVHSKAAPAEPAEAK